MTALLKTTPVILLFALTYMEGSVELNLWSDLDHSLDSLMLLMVEM